MTRVERVRETDDVDAGDLLHERKVDGRLVREHWRVHERRSARVSPIAQLADSLARMAVTSIQLVTTPIDWNATLMSPPITPSVLRPPSSAR